jgi:putative DNA methylase
MSLTPHSWANRSALIESLFPVQKISVESFKEQMAGAGKTLTALGSYWKGRKPLILNKACILGCLLPATGDALKDLEVFELLMGMDPESLQKRLENKIKGKEAENITDLLGGSYQAQVYTASRPEEMPDSELYNHIWPTVNAHLGTSAYSIPELIEQIGIARFGHRPKVADVFCGSGQIPFEAARLGCDVYASDLNPIACMLTWGAFNIVGAGKEKRDEIDKAQKKLAEQVQAEIDALGVESDGRGWRAKSFLYCVEVVCPESGWKVPLMPSFVISKGCKVVAKLLPVPAQKRYEIEVHYVGTDTELNEATLGTVQGNDIVHSPDGISIFRVSISSIRGDYKERNENKNRLRLWEKADFIPHHDDIFQERLYCIHWMKKKPTGSKFIYQFRSVTEDDLAREQKVIDYVNTHLVEWQEKGFIPDMVIEAGDKTDEPIRTRGWTHWHHLWGCRQLLYLAIIRQHIDTPEIFVLFSGLLDYTSKLCRWATSPKGNTKIGGGKRTGGASDNPTNVFYNQALNTFLNYGTRSLDQLFDVINKKVKSVPCINSLLFSVTTDSAHNLKAENDIYITDPPYGDAVKYEEITEFFIAWLRKNPPPEFAQWTWDSRRALAIKGEDEGFRQGMIAAYSKMAEKMPDNGIQVLMFTHQSGAIWSDMTNIIWASGLQVTAAWYVVTETDSAIRQGANVTGTIMLVLRKRTERLETFRDDLGWLIEDAVKKQIEGLTGLDQSVRQHGSEGLYNDADLQMAGYAAALKVLTTYAVIDGKKMEIEARAPRQKGIKSFVDEMIDFAVQTAVQFLIPGGFSKEDWQKLAPVERYYLKMVDMEAQGYKTLDNYQNFAKAFRVQHFDVLMAIAKANSARLLTSAELKSSLMSDSAELANTPLRALLYAMWELQKNLEVDDVLLHLVDNCRECRGQFLANKPLLITIADYMAIKRTGLKPEKTYESEASSARILAEALKSQRLG